VEEKKITMISLVTASENEKAHAESLWNILEWIVAYRNEIFWALENKFAGKQCQRRWKPCDFLKANSKKIFCFLESSCLEMQLKIGGAIHQRLNINRRPIAKKYCEGKMKRTSKGE